MDGTNGKNGLVARQGIDIDEQHCRDTRSLDDLDGPLPDFFRPIRSAPSDGNRLSHGKFEDVGVGDADADAFDDGGVIEGMQVGCRVTVGGVAVAGGEVRCGGGC